MAACPTWVTDLFPLWSFYVVPWMLGLGVAAGMRAGGRGWLQAVGAGLMTVPIWDTAWGILDSVCPLVQGGFVLRAYTRHELSSLYESKFLSDLGYVGAGFLLYTSASLRDLWHQTPRRLAKAATWIGFPTGRIAPWLADRRLASGRWREGDAVLAGLVIFPILFLATLLIDSLLSGVPSLNQSDETSVFANMTVYHTLLISLSAGFGEELVFRGIVQTGLARFLDRVERTAAQRAAASRPGAVAMAMAVGIQSVFFGLAHSGYGTWSHVILPALFGLVAGLVAWAFGLWASIVLHVLVDVYAFGAELASRHAWANETLIRMLEANVFLTLIALVWVAWRLRGAARSREVAELVGR